MGAMGIFSCQLQVCQHLSWQDMAGIAAALSSREFSHNRTIEAVKKKRKSNRSNALMCHAMPKQSSNFRGSGWNMMQPMPNQFPCCILHFCQRKSSCATSLGWKTRILRGACTSKRFWKLQVCQSARGLQGRNPQRSHSWCKQCTLFLWAIARAPPCDGAVSAKGSHAIWFRA